MDLRNELPLVHQAIYSPVFHTKREANFTTQSAHIYVDTQISIKKHSVG